MKLFSNIKQKVKTKKFIIGACVFLITFVLCMLVFRNWDVLKTFILDGKG
jgi:TRAP-type mannitol/chloroaromatic compound transport system permease small subunit